MSYPPSLYPRKLRHAQMRVPGEYLVTWADGTVVDDFRSEAAALHYINYSLRVIRDVRDAKLTGPDGEYLSCKCGCGRVFRDEDGVRVESTPDKYDRFCAEQRLNALAKTPIDMNEVRR